MSKLLSILRHTTTKIGSGESIFSLQRLAGVWASSFRTSSSTTTAPTDTSDKQVVEEDPLSHSTGLDRVEQEARLKGIDITYEEWLDAPFGTVEKPVEVPSVYEERIVGVPDPEDDCVITWGIIKEGEPPRQLVEGGEYFVLKRIPLPDWAQHD